MVVSWENQRKWIGIEKIAMIASALGIQEHDLFRGEDKPLVLPPPSPTTEELLIRFGRLLSKADPERLKEAIELLEIGQPDQAASKPSRKHTSSK